MTGNTEGACLARIRAHLRDAPESQVRVGHFVLDNADRARRMAIEELAAGADTSTATVSRFCRALDYDSYRDFQLDLVTAVAQTEELTLDDFVAGAPPEVVMGSVFEINRSSLEQTGKVLDRDALVEIVQRIEEAPRTLFLGIGGSGLVAREGAQRFFSLGLTAAAVVDPAEMVFVTANASEGDVVIGISHTGLTTHVIEAVQTARERGAATAALTNYPRSPLAEAAEFRLITAFREHHINAAVSSSRIAQMCVVDCLYFLLGSRGSEKAMQLAADAERRVQRMLRS